MLDHRTNQVSHLLYSVDKGSITEFAGCRSSGMTACLLALLADLTSQSEFAALIDAADSFNPSSAEKMGVDFDRLLWVRCPGDIDSALKSVDYLLHAGGFGIVILDLADVRPEIVAGIPRSFWFRFRLSIENTPTRFLLLAPVACAGSSCHLSIQFVRQGHEWVGSPGHRMIRCIHSRQIIRRKSEMLLAGRRISLEKIKRSAIER